MSKHIQYSSLIIKESFEKLQFIKDKIEEKINKNSKDFNSYEKNEDRFQLIFYPRFYQPNFNYQEFLCFNNMDILNEVKEDMLNYNKLLKETFNEKLDILEFSIQDKNYFSVYTVGKTIGYCHFNVYKRNLQKEEDLENKKNEEMLLLEKN